MIRASLNGSTPDHPLKAQTRRDRESGNTLVEMALTLTAMMALFVGLLDVSMIVFVQTTLVEATREASRFAITYGSAYNGNSCGASQASCITKAAQANAFGFLSGSNASLVTVNYYTANDLTNPVMACNSGTCTLRGTLPQTLSNGEVVSYSNQPGNIVEVVVSNYSWNWILPISATGFRLTAASIGLGGSSMDVLGGLPAGTVVPPSP